MPRGRRLLEPPLYQFRVRILGGFYAPAKSTTIWRVLEIAANLTLVDLGNAIPLAFGFDDAHLWSFFLSGKAWDRATEYALHSEADQLGGARRRAAGRVPIREVPFPGVAGKQEGVPVPLRLWG
jgi:Plasmid pRiA4b ORF-3-like protein